MMGNGLGQEGYINRGRWMYVSNLLGEKVAGTMFSVYNIINI